MLDDKAIGYLERFLSVYLKTYKLKKLYLLVKVNPEKHLLPYIKHAKICESSENKSFQ